jgi:hypothetical protein
LGKRATARVFVFWKYSDGGGLGVDEMEMDTVMIREVESSEKRKDEIYKVFEADVIPRNVT